MVRYHAVNKNDCQSSVRYVLELSGLRSKRTIEPPQPVAFLADSEQQNNLIFNHGPMQATAFYQNVYGVWGYKPQAQYKPWNPDATGNKHSFCEKQSDNMQINFINWKFPISKI